MDLKITDHSDVIEIKLDGHFKDAAIWGQHSDEISAVLKDRTRPVIAIDLRGIQSLSSTGLGSLVVFQKSIQAVKGEVVLTGMTPWLMKTMRIVQFQKIFRMFKTLEDWRRVKDLKEKEGEEQTEGDKSEAEVEAT